MRASARTSEVQQPMTLHQNSVAIRGETASAGGEELSGAACERVSGAGVDRSLAAGTGIESGERAGVGYGVEGGSAAIIGGRPSGGSGGGSGLGGSAGGGGPEGGSRPKARMEPESPLAFIRPEKSLEFNWIPGMPDPVAFIEITNLIDSQLSFKIKCSYPEAYRVEPHWGFIDAGEIATVAITLMPGWLGNVSSHKFLVAVIHAPDVFDESNKTLKELWNSVPVDPTNYMEHKMTCNYIGYGDKDDNRRSPYGTKITQINRLLNNNQRLSAQLNALVTFQLFLGLVIILCGAVIIIVYYLGHGHLAQQGADTTGLQ